MNLRDKLQIKLGEKVSFSHVSIEMVNILGLEGENNVQNADAYIMQVQNISDLHNYFPAWINHTSNVAKIWIIYPKSSGNINTDLTRDTGWEILKKFDYSPVRIISINKNFSALRIKPNNQIKKQVIPAFKEIDIQNRIVLLPKDVLQEIKNNPSVINAFNQWSFTKKKEAVLGILTAKKKETRNSRIAKLVLELTKL